MTEAIAGRVDDLGGMPEALLPLRERLLANLVMIGQIPAASGHEERRVRFMLDRFVEAGMSDATADETGNAVGRLTGTGQDARTLLLVAHLDTIYPASHDHGVTVETNRVTGPAVGDNALGAAVIALIPTVLETLGIELSSNLILLGTTRSLGRGNHEGIRFFLDHLRDEIDFGICVEGIQLGRVNHFSIGTSRADITCEVRPSPEPSRSYGSESALVVLNHIINRLLGIETPSRPFTRIKLGKLWAGVAYDVEPDHAELGLEIVSHSDEMIDRIESQLRDIVTEMGARHAVDATLDVFSKIHSGGLPFAHPLVRSVLEVLERLEIEPDQGHSPSELSELLQRDIPSVTLGITNGGKSRKQRPDFVLIDPILKGVAQLVGVIQAIDRGACDEPVERKTP